MKTKKILIVGGAGRIVEQFVHSLIKENFKIVVADIHIGKLSKIIKKNKEKIKFIKCNIKKDKNINILIKRSKDFLDQIDAVIYCAYPKSANWGANFDKISRKSINEDLDGQLTSCIIFAQKIINYFLSIKAGNLIFFSSILGVHPPKFFHYKNTNMTCPIEYSATKSAIIMVTKYLAKLYLKKNIRVNCLSPGGILDNQNIKFIRNYKKSCGKKGLLDPKDLFGTIRYLLSNDSKYLNGQNIVIDDGWSL